VAAAVVALYGPAHPHGEMYLETLGALEVVGETVVVESETEWASALGRGDVTHVLVALPNDRTPQAILDAVEAGKAVLSEKPGARSRLEFEPVLQALRRRPVPFCVAYLNRWSPAVRQMRELFRAGAIGRLTSVELRMVTTQVSMRNPESWLFQRQAAGGGVLAWLACHWLDALRYVTSEEIVRVQAQLATIGGEAIDVEDAAVVAFRTTNGAVGSLHAGYLLAVGNPGYRAAGHDISMILRGSLGTIAYSGGRNEAPLVLESVAPEWRAASRRTFQFTPTPSPGYGGLAGLDFFRTFLQATSPAETPANADDAMRVLEILDAIYAAGASGGTVEVQRYDPL